MACTAQQFLADAACLDCLVYPGPIRDAVELVVLVDIYNGVVPDPNGIAALVNRASCYACTLSGASLEAAKLAVLVAMAGGTTIDTTPQGLLNASACLLCVIPVGMLLAVRLALACQMQNGERVDTTAQGLLNAARCYTCYNGNTLLGMWVAALCSSANGETFDCSPEGLLALASCLNCVPVGLVQLAGISILLNLGGGGLGQDYRITSDGTDRITSDGTIRIVDI